MLVRSNAAAALDEPLLTNELPPSGTSMRRAVGRIAISAMLCASGVMMYCTPPPTVSAAIASSPEASSKLSIVEVWETAEGNGARLRKLTSPTSHSSEGRPSTPSTVFRLSLMDEHQVIEGFGGAITQASGSVWRKLTSDRLRSEVMEKIFGVSGIRASLSRIPINSCTHARA